MDFVALSPIKCRVREKLKAMDKNSEQGTVAQFCGDRYQNSGLVHMGEDDYGSICT